MANKKPFSDYLLLIFLLCLSGYTAFAANGRHEIIYPSFDEVVDHESRCLPLLNDSGVIEKYSLAKKPEGWFRQTEKYIDNDWQVIESKLCWKAESGQYVGADANNNADLASQVKNDFLKYAVVKYDFEHECYFGYNGWTDDVIGLLADSVRLCDHNYEALARAYSSEAFYRVNQWSDFGVRNRRMNLEEHGNCMTDAQVDTFKKYEQLAAATYLRLEKQNPAYETMIGDVFCKYSNEIMATYLLLAYYQNFAEATKCLKPGLYDGFMIAFAKNLLSSCEQNAILFTQGDNDTYPLYYVQAFYGYRKDVLIVNASLLNTSRYINFLRAGVYDALPLPLTMDAKEYAGDSLSYLRRSDDKWNELVKGTGLDFDPGTDILYKSDIMLLNMIAANNWHRPVYISISAEPAVALKMDKYFVAEGLAYRLTKDKGDNTSLYDARVNTAFDYNFLMNRMEQTDWAHEPVIDENIIRITDNYQGIFSRAAAAEADKGAYNECVELLNRYLQAFPKNKIAYTVYMIDMPNLYARCHKPAEGKAIEQELTRIANKTYEAHIDKSGKEKPAEWKREMQVAMYTLQQLIPFVKDNYDKKYGLKYEAAFNTKRAKYEKVLAQLDAAR